MVMPTTLNIQRVVTTQSKGFIKRHFKHRRDFIDAGVILQTGRDNAHHRRDLKTGNAVDGRQHADDLNGLRGNGNLFLRFAQRGGNQRGVGAVYRAPRKSDLTRVLT